MKARHKMMRKHKARGGETESPASGAREYEEDLSSNPPSYTADSNVVPEARERKRGGRAAKHVGKVHGAAARHHAGRKPRKSGGRTGSDMSPLTSAHKGTLPKKHSDIEID